MSSESLGTGYLSVDAWRELPAEVHVPIRTMPADGMEADVELYEAGGVLALPVYTSLESLAASCGAEQAWMRIVSARIPELVELGNAHGILVDAAMPGRSATNDPDSGWWYAPSRPFTEGDAEAQLELQPIVGGQLALPVFSSPEALRAGCGEHQPWVSFRAELLEEVRESTGANVVFKDRGLPQHVRHAAPKEDGDAITG